MSDLLSLVGSCALLLAVLGVCKGSLRSFGLRSRQQCAKAGALAFALLLAAGALAPDAERPADPAGQAAPEQVAAATAAAVPTRAALPVAARAAATPAPKPKARPAGRGTAATALLVMAAGGDGDSWRDTRGVEYRMGLINTPEHDECGGAAATDYRKRALASGFRARPYATDGYGRKVSVIVAPNGVNLNVAMARDGIADDRYLQRYRHENPALASQLDVAFADARAAGRGIWTACGSASAGRPASEGGSANQAPAQAPQPASGGRCHPDYRTCIPIRGDGSGRGAANDLDCGEIGRAVHLRQVGRDPYRLDGSDRDGVGCE